MRARALARLCLAALATTTLGCISGAIYSHVTVPLDVNLDRTPVLDQYARDSRNTFDYYIQVEWGSDGIGDVAKKYGFTRIHYADLETLTVLGVWTQEWVRVYGEKRSP